MKNGATSSWCSDNDNDSVDVRLQRLVFEKKFNLGSGSSSSSDTFDSDNSEPSPIIKATMHQATMKYSSKIPIAEKIIFFEKVLETAPKHEQDRKAHDNARYFIGLLRYRCKQFGAAIGSLTLIYNPAPSHFLLHAQCLEEKATSNKQKRCMNAQLFQYAMHPKNFLNSKISVIGYLKLENLLLNMKMIFMKD